VSPPTRCDRCDVGASEDQLCPKRIITRFLREIPEGLVCRDDVACKARVEAWRNGQHEAALERASGLRRPDADAFLTDRQRARIDFR